MCIIIDGGGVLRNDGGWWVESFNINGRPVDSKLRSSCTLSVEDASGDERGSSNLPDNNRLLVVEEDSE